MIKTKVIQISVIQTVELLKSEKTYLLKHKVPSHSFSLHPTTERLACQETLNNGLALVADTTSAAVRASCSPPNARYRR